jgi:MFS family permease
MGVFTLIWSGQFVSYMGTSLTEFALAIWLYQHTSSVTQFTLASLCAALPGVLVAPLAGVVVDRHSRRWILLCCDILAALSTLGAGTLAFTGHLNVWFICLANIIASVSGAFQRPAYMALVTQLVPQERLNRVNGMIQFANASTQLVAPVLSGALLPIIQLQGIFLIDLTTFLFSMGTLLLARYSTEPRTVHAGGEQEQKGNFVQDVAVVWRYLQQHSGLVILLLLFTVTNFLTGMVSVLVKPMILSFTSAALLGTLMSIGGIGMIVGALTMSVWRGFKRRVHTILCFLSISSICLALVGVSTSFLLIAVAGFAFYFCLPLINGSVHALFQNLTDTSMQGRLFSVLDMLTGAVVPLAYLLSGPLADALFEPLLRADGSLSHSVGQIIGVGQGRGIGFMFILIGGILLIITLCCSASSRLRHLEAEKNKQETPALSAQEAPVSD